MIWLIKFCLSHKTACKFTQNLRTDYFHKPIHRNKIQIFNQANKCILRSNKIKVVKTIEADRNIIGRLLAISTRNGRLADFERAMKYSLAQIPLIIWN